MERRKSDEPAFSQVLQIAFFRLSTRRPQSQTTHRKTNSEKDAKSFKIGKQKLISHGSILKRIERDISASSLIPQIAGYHTKISDYKLGQILGKV